MASESTSSQQSQQLIPSSKVNFRCTDSIIGFNNVVALLEHSNELYRPMLSFLSNCCINRALTLQPTAMYVEYLKEFWYTAEVEEETKTITFLLSWWDKPLSFTQDEFISAIGLPICKDVVPLPPKETVRAGLATLGLFDKDKPTLSSTVLVNSSPLKMKYFSPIWKLFMQYIVKCLGGMQGSHDQMNLNQQTIAYCLIWGLEIDIGGIIFSDLVHKLQNGKKNRELNICYTRFLSLIFEKLLGRDYVSNDLTLVKPHTITAASFQKPLTSEVPLTSHMLKVAKLSEEPEQSLIPPSRESKATTDLKTKKKKIPPSSKPKSLYKVKVILPKKQVAKAQHAEVTVAIDDATKSLVASELAEEQGNQLSATEAKKVLDQNVEEEKDAEFVAMEEVAEEQSLEFPTVEQLLDEADKLNKAVQETPESPYDTESKIKVVKSFLTSHISELQDQTMHDSEETADIHEDSDSDLQSMPDDDLRSVSGFDTADSDDTHENEVSKSDHIFQDDNASAERLSLPDHMDHICEEVSSLHSKLGDMESSIVQQVSAEIKSSLPALVTNTLKEQLPSFLSDALKDTLQLLKDSIKSSVSKSIAEELPHVEAQRFVLLQKELSKTLHKNMRKSIRLKVRKGMKEVRDKLSFCTSTVATNSQHVQDLRVMFKDMVSLLEAAKVFKKANAEGEKGKISGANTADIVQEEQPSTQVVTNEEKALVVHNLEEMKSEGTVSIEDDLDDDELDKQSLSKRFKIITPIPNPIPLNTFVLGYLLKPEEQRKSLHEFTDQLFGTTSSKFSPTPPREPTPPRDPAKGKEVVIVKEQGTLSQEKFNNQIKKLKKISDLKAQKDTSEQELRKMFNQATLKARAKKWTEHEAKKAKILEEYNHQISFRFDPLPITKISYAVNSNKEATMKITKDDNPLNLIVHPNFRLKSLGFSEWLEVMDHAKKLGLPPPPALATFGMTAEEKKRKRTQFLKEAFVTKDIRFDGMNRNLIPPPGVVPIEGLVINEAESGIFFMNRNTDTAFQRESEFHLTPTIQLIRIQNQIKVDSEIADEMFRKLIYVIEARSDCTKARETVMKGLSECKASESNIRRIRVKDIVKEVEDYLKTYSSAGMDISWRETQYHLKARQKVI
ncbi:hypothetical protein Tco_0560467 [Tanacetum coccineum]